MTRCSLLFGVFIVVFLCFSVLYAGETSFGVGVGMAYTHGIGFSLRRTFGDTKAKPYGELAVVNGIGSVDGGVAVDWTRRLYSNFGLGLHSQNDLVADNWHYNEVPLGFRITKRLSLEWEHRSNCNNRCVKFFPKGSPPNHGIDVLQVRMAFEPTK
jgi:hypothetical protein